MRLSIAVVVAIALGFWAVPAHAASLTVDSITNDARVGPYTEYTYTVSLAPNGQLISDGNFNDSFSIGYINGFVAIPLRAPYRRMLRS